MSRFINWAKQVWGRWLSRRIPSATQLTLTQKNIFIVPSRAGWGFIGVLFILLLTAINYQNSLIYALTFWLLSMGLAAMWLTFHNLSGLTLNVGQASACFAGEDIELPIKLSNKKHWSAGLLLAYKGNLPQLCSVNPALPLQVSLPYKTSRRGRLKTSRLRVQTSFPFGLFTAWTWAALDYPVVIYPRKEVTDLKMSEGDVDDKLPSQSLVTSQDGDFSNIRDYKVGDPMQRIAWKQSARTDDLKVLELETEQGVSCWLNWDSLMGLDTERRLSRLTAWVVQAENEGWLYGLNIPGKKIAPSSGQGHYLECLKALALWGHNES